MAPNDYFCDPPGNGRVDTIDEIASRRARFLTPEEQAILGPYQDLEDNQLAWDDSNGDGSICDFDELTNENISFGIRKITFAVYPPAG